MCIDGAPDKNNYYKIKIPTHRGTEINLNNVSIAELILGLSKEKNYEISTILNLETIINLKPVVDFKISHYLKQMHLS